MRSIHSYLRPIVDNLETRNDGDRWPTYDTRWGTFSGYRLPAQLSLKLQRLEVDPQAFLQTSGINGPIVRAEFFWESDELGTQTLRRGLIMYDTRHVPVAHMRSAVLGYGGAGPALSQAVTELIGVSPEMFKAVHEAVEHQRYVVVFSREVHRVISGVDISVLCTHVRPEWDWWRVR
jgi:hypothetical protein